MEPPVESDRAQDRDMLARAVELRSPLARTARFAALNSMVYLVFGALSVMLSLSTDAADLAALGVGATLLYVGLSSRRSARLLRDGDAASAHRLARNELILMIAIAVYCGLMLTVIKPTSDEFDKALRSAGLPINEQEMQTWTRELYGSVLIVTLLYQGYMARHYRRRAEMAETYLAEVPEWARKAVSALPG